VLTIELLDDPEELLDVLGATFGLDRALCLQCPKQPAVLHDELHLLTHRRTSEFLQLAQEARKCADLGARACTEPISLRRGLDGLVQGYTGRDGLVCQPVNR
jgi:hypothetical protein